MTNQRYTEIYLLFCELQAVLKKIVFADSRWKLHHAEHTINYKVIMDVLGHKLPEAIGAEEAWAFKLKYYETLENNQTYWEQKVNNAPD